jgi:hypothetical protein
MRFEPDLSPLLCPRALAVCGLLAWVLAIGPAVAGALEDKAKESGCGGNKPLVVEGSTYKCYTNAGAIYFNVPGAPYRSPESAPGKSAGSPTGYPRVDTATQKSRDEMRRKVLTDELASEEKLLDEARVAYDNGAPTPLPDEKSDVEKYRQRIARLRQAVQLHERNVDALKKELANVR